MSAPDARRLARAVRDARRFAADARRLARRHARTLGGAKDAIDAAAAEVDGAAAEGEGDRLAAALRELEARWDAHLARFVKPAWREYLEAVALAALLALAVRAFLVDAVSIPSGSMSPTLRVGDHVFVEKSAYAVRVPFTDLALVELAAPRRGDVVVFADPRERGAEYVKRVVGLPGDVVELRDQVLHVNGVPQPRSEAGDYHHREPGGPAGAPSDARCRRYHEALARGPLEALPADAPGLAPGLAEARWQAAAAAGVATYDVLQCRTARRGAREGPFEVVRPGHVFVLGDNRDLSADSREGGWQVPWGKLRGRARLVFWSWGDGGRLGGDGRGLRVERLFKPVE